MQAVNALWIPYPLTRGKTRPENARTRREIMAEEYYFARVFRSASIGDTIVIYYEGYGHSNIVLHI